MARKKKAKGPEPFDNRDRIEPDLRPLARLISTVKYDSHQTNTRDRRSIEELKDDLQKYGQKKNVYVLKSTMEVKAGNGIVQAALELGWTYLAMVVSDDEEAMAREYAIRDNRSAQLSTYDVNALVAEMTDLGIVPETVGWTPDEWSVLLPDVDLSSATQEPPEDFPEVDENISTEHTCPKCGYAWSGGR